MELLRVDDGRVAVVQLRRAPTYAEREGAQTYQLERIIFNLYENAETALAAFERGEVNAVGYIPTALLETATQTPGMAVYTALEPTVGFVLFNFGRETTTFFQDRRFRAALAYGTDSEGLVREHLDGQVVPATNPLIPGSWAWDPSVTWPQRNYETAQTLLSRARVDLPVSFTLLCPDSPEMVALCNDIAAQWSDLDGVSVTVETAEQPALLERVRARDFDAAIVELSLAGMADPDPYVFWHQGQIESGQNYGGVDDGPISEALEQARRDPSGVNRASWYRLFQQRFAERVPAIPLYYPVYAYGVDNQIEGVQLGLISDPSDRFRSLWAWSY
jgi:peptide/nickel transport system substrate-binding protein